MTWLAHYGVKGQKKGVRRGPPYPLNRTYIKNSRNYKKQAEKANDVFRTLSKKEKYYLEDDENATSYTRPEDYKYAAVYSQIKQYRDTPVSVIDVWYNEDNPNAGNVSIMVRNDEHYRGKGYAKKAVDEMLEWFGDSKLDELQWGVVNENAPSIKLAESRGFELADKYDTWSLYKLKKK